MMTDLHPERPVIVVVEDDPHHAFFFQELIRTETPYQSWVFRDVQAVVARLDDLIRIKPLLFIIDYLFPVSNGLDLYDHLQQVEQLRTVPVLLTTASSPGSLSDALAIRDLYVVEKPFEVEDVVATINKLIQGT